MTRQQKRDIAFAALCGGLAGGSLLAFTHAIFASTRLATDLWIALALLCVALYCTLPSVYVRYRRRRAERQERDDQ